MQEPKLPLSVVICTRNRPVLLDSALKSLARQTSAQADFEVLVVDNGPSDRTREVAESYADRLNLRYLIEPIVGLSRARNTAYGAARGRYVAYLDDDAEATPNWVEEICKVIRRGAPAIFGGPYFPLYRSEKPRWFRDEYGSYDRGNKPLRLCDTPFLAGPNIVICRDLLERLGGFRTDYGMAGERIFYGEETELQVRALRQMPDVAICYFPWIVVGHLMRPEKMSLRSLVRMQWEKSRARARRQDAERVPYSVLTLLQHLCANAVLLVCGLALAPLRDSGKYAWLENYMVEKLGPAIGGISAALDRLGRTLTAGPTGAPIPRHVTARADAWPHEAVRMAPEFEPGLVSVIVPTYNRAHLIEKTLQSVRRQTYRPIELLVVDDGSTDNTQQVVREFAEAAAGELRVRYVRQENQGAQVARNRGLVESRGEFIQFLDSDDLLHPDKLSAQARAMRQEPQLQYVFSAWAMLYDSGSRPSQWWRKGFRPGRHNVLDLMLGGDRHQLLPLCTSNGLYRRSLCLRLGPWDTEQRCQQPRLYNLRMLLLGVSYRHLPAVHVWARQHPAEQITDHFVEPTYLADRHRTWRKMCGMLEDAGLLNRRRRRLVARRYYGLARSALIAGATPLGMELLDDGVALCPPSGMWFKLRLARSAYRLLGAAGANRLFALKMKLAEALRRAPPRRVKLSSARSPRSRNQGS